MRDKLFLDIKERMLGRSKELWGIKKSDNIDPILNLLIDVFAFEQAKLHREVEISDSQLLYRLSRILVSNKWSLPLPAHGLLNIYPTDEVSDLTTQNHFYVNKSQFGQNAMTVYFTPIVNTEVINATVRCMLFEEEFVYHTVDKGSLNGHFINEESRINDYSCWLGIQLSDELLADINHINLSILLADVSLYSYLNTMSIFDDEGVALDFVKGGDFKRDVDEEHYCDEILSYYQDYFYKVKLHKNHSLKSIAEMFPDTRQKVDGVNYDEKLLWLKFDFPEVFSKNKIKEAEFAINAVPVVNRKSVYVQHNFITNGKIASLPSEQENYFLNVKSVYDNKGALLKNVLKSNDDSLEGTYSLYFGNIERFDTRSAKALVDKVAHLIREEGNAFAAMNPEKLNKYLHGVVGKLEEIEAKATEKLQHINISNERAFLLTYPNKNTISYEIEYWVSNAEIGNGFNEKSEFLQYGTSVFDVKRIKLLTETIGGRVRRGEREQIDSLRYGLLTRERIVSTEDVKSFVKKQIGDHVNKIDIKPGVMISTEKKKGIIRTVDVIVKLNDLFLSEINLQRLSSFLEKELTQKSIGNTPYKVILK